MSCVQLGERAAQWNATTRVFSPGHFDTALHLAMGITADPVFEGSSRGRGWGVATSAAAVSSFHLVFGILEQIGFSRYFGKWMFGEGFVVMVGR